MNKFIRYTTIMCFILFALYLITPAQADGDDWYFIGEITIQEYLDEYLTHEDKAAIDIQLEYYIRGHVQGIVNSFAYLDLDLANTVMVCIRESFHTPKTLRTMLLKNGTNAILKNVEVGTMLYAMVHITCDEYLGEYEFGDDDMEEIS